MSSFRFSSTGALSPLLVLCVLAIVFSLSFVFILFAAAAAGLVIVGRLLYRVLAPNRETRLKHTTHRHEPGPESAGGYADYTLIDSDRHDPDRNV